MRDKDGYTSYACPDKDTNEEFTYMVNTWVRERDSDNKHAFQYHMFGIQAYPCPLFGFQLHLNYS